MEGKEDKMIWYKAVSYKMKIEEMEIVGSTKDFVKLPNGRREAKSSFDYGIFWADTRNMAKEALVEWQKNKCAEFKLSYEMELENLKRMENL